jgi:hypothetical protein
MNRVINLKKGRAYVVSDLHGEWEPYVRYRDHFLYLLQNGYADVFILLGDLVHGYGPSEEDASLPMLLDVMRLQAELGPQTVIMLLGNHELVHIYGVTLAKGGHIFTPRLEHAMGAVRPQVIEFLQSLPLLVRTAGGVMLTHAGASAATSVPQAARVIFNFSHRELLDQVDRLLLRANVPDLLKAVGIASEAEYSRLAWTNLAITGREDPRYLDLLRSFVVGTLEPEWPLLWEFLFTQCEAAFGEMLYARILEKFLKTYSARGAEQRVLVTGHMPVEEGYEIVAGRQVRMASWAHARPNEAGHYLLLDVAEPIEMAADLEPYLYPIP